jgi:anti-anti-sigma factor
MALIVENPYLIIDLTETIFLDSSGLAALAKINRSTKDKRGEFRVTSCTKDVSTVIHLTRFDKVLSIYKDLPSAMAT